MYYLALAYSTGDGVQRDYPGALLWFGRSVDYENAYGGNIVRPRVQNAIGGLYENGSGVGNNLMLAYLWYSLAATGGSDDASKNLSRVALLLKPEQLREAQNLARDWKPGNRISPRTP